MRIESSEKLLEVLCRAAEVGAYGSGEVTILPKGSGGFMKLYDGGIVKVKAVTFSSSCKWRQCGHC